MKTRTAVLGPNLHRVPMMLGEDLFHGHELALSTLAETFDGKLLSA